MRALDHAGQDTQPVLGQKRRQAVANIVEPAVRILLGLVDPSLRNIAASKVSGDGAIAA